MADQKKAISIAAKKAKSRKVWGKVGICAAVLAAIAIVAVSYFTSSTYYRSTTAVEIGEHTLSVADFNYYFRTAYQNMYTNIKNTYGDYADMLLDTSKPLSEQQYNEDQTWEDYLTGVTLDNLKDIYAVYDEAQEKGFALSESGAADIDNVVSSYSTAAKEANYKLDNYLTAIFGKGVNEKVLRRLLEIVSISGEYTEKAESDITYTASEAAAYYDAHKNDIDSVSARLYSLSFKKEDAEEGASGRTKEEAQAIADGLLEAEHTPEGFTAYISENLTAEEQLSFGDGSNTFYQGLAYNSIGEAGLADWLFDASRAEGDMGWVEGDGQFYLLYFVERTDNSYSMVNMRHILIKPVTDDEGNEVEDAMGEARKTLEGIYEDWQADNGGEDEFAVLANVYSEDGDGTTGGLYENVTKGQMVEPIDTWLFDPARRSGDSEFIETQYGWHLVYFVGNGGNYKDQLLDTAIRDEKFTEWHEGVLAGYEVKTVEPGFGLSRK